MFRALLCPSPGACDYDVHYHIGRVVLGLLYVGGEVRLGWSSVRAAGYSLSAYPTNTAKPLSHPTTSLNRHRKVKGTALTHSQTRH